jgi:ubiquinone/menaquinone biosynthesis C-methylase UbiE
MSRARYDDVAPRYDAAIRPLERWFLTRWRAEALSLLPENSRILEVGAGTGLNFRFYPHGSSGVASEFSREMLKLASHKARPEGLNLVQADAEALPFATAAFEAGFATLTFCTIPSPSNAFKEFRRVVKTGGRLVLLEHVRPGGVLGPVFDLLNVLTSRLGDHVNRRTVECAAEAGWTIERVERRFLGIFNLIVCKA